MKKEIQNLNKAFENRVRFGIMSVLMVESSVNFNTLKESLNVTDGNLASHLKALEKLEYINIEKSFVGRKTNTDYFATTLGQMAFKSHINELEKILKQLK